MGCGGTRKIVCSRVGHDVSAAEITCGECGWWHLEYDVREIGSHAERPCEGCEDCAPPECDGSGWVYPKGYGLAPGVKCPGCRRCDPCPTCRSVGTVMATTAKLGRLEYTLHSPFGGKQQCPDCGGTGTRRSDAD